jgi:hypothetical protein
LHVKHWSTIANARTNRGHAACSLNDIVKLEKREFSVGKTVILVIVVAGVVAGVAVAISDAAPAVILSGTH